MSFIPQLPSQTFTAIPNSQAQVDGMINSSPIGRYLLRTKANSGIGGFIFDYLGDINLGIDADITDHFTENNDAFQDHIAIRPIELTMRGFQSELALPKPQGVVGALAAAQSALTQVNAYLGKYTPGVAQTLSGAVTQVQNTVNTINLTLAKAQNVISLFPGAPPTKSKQEKAYIQLSAAMIKKQPMTIDTPYGVMANMFIKRLTFVPPEDTKTWSDISVTLKQISFVQVASVLDNGSFAGRLAQQAQAAANKGNGSGAQVNQSAAYDLAVAGGLVKS